MAAAASGDNAFVQSQSAPEITTRNVKLPPKPGQKLSTLVVGRPNKRHSPVPLAIVPALRWWKVHSWLKRCLNLYNIPRPPCSVVQHVGISLRRVQIELRDALQIQPPPRILPRPKGVIDHVTHRADAHGAQRPQGTGPQGEHLVRPKHIRTLAPRRSQHLAIQPFDPGAGLHPMQNLTQQRLSGLVTINIQRNNVMAQPLQRPTPVLCRIVWRKSRRVQYLQRPLRA